MTTNEELWNFAENAAKLYQRIEKEALDKKKITTKPGQLIKTALETTNKAKFIKAQTEVVEFAANELLEELKSLTERVNKMSEDTFRYLLVLINFIHKYNQSK